MKPWTSAPNLRKAWTAADSYIPTVPCGRRAGGSDQVFEAHDVFVSDAHEYIVPVPEDRPAILLLDVGGVNLTLVLELVAANVDAVRVQLEPLLVCSGWLVSPVHGTGPSGTCATSARRSGGRRPTAAYTAALLCAGKSSAAVINGWSTCRAADRPSPTRTLSIQSRKSSPANRHSTRASIPAQCAACSSVTTARAKSASSPTSRYRSRKDSSLIGTSMPLSSPSCQTSRSLRTAVSAGTGWSRSTTQTRKLRKASRSLLSSLRST